MAGTVLQLVYLLLKSKGGYNFNFNSILKEKSSFALLNASFIFIIIIEAIGQLYILADRYFYNSVDIGGIAALNYAQAVFMLPISILSVALSTVFFPKFSEYVNAGLPDKLEEIFNESLRINIVLFVPLTFLFLFYGDFFIKILFERGKFLAADTRLTYDVLSFYSLSLIFYSAYAISNKILYSTGLIKNLLYITITGILLKIIANYSLVPILKQNGLALSTSVSYMFFFFASLILIIKKTSFSKKSIFFTELIFITGNGIVSLLIMRTLAVLFPENIVYNLFEIILFLMLFYLNLHFTASLTTFHNINLINPVIFLGTGPVS